MFNYLVRILIQLSSNKKIQLKTALHLWSMTKIDNFQNWLEIQYKASK